MDSNLMYLASSVGIDKIRQDEIIKSVWNEEEHSNMSVTSAESLCGSLDDSSYGRCMNAANSCGSDSKCDTVARKYAKALGKGYAGSFNDFKKRSENLANLGELALSAIGGLFGGGRNGGQNEGYDSNGGYSGNYDKPSSTGLIIGVSAVALIGIGTAIYFATRK